MISGINGINAAVRAGKPLEPEGQRLRCEKAETVLCIALDMQDSSTGRRDIAICLDDIAYQSGAAAANRVRTSLWPSLHGSLANGFLKRIP
jgi:hypothetical protein